MMRPPMHLWNVEADLVAVEGGHRNTVLKTTGQHGNLVFKTTRRTEAALRWLDAVHDCAEAAGFHVPRLRTSRNGRLSEKGWTCEPFLSGRPATTGDLAALGQRIDDLHRLSQRLPQRPGFVAAPNLRAGQTSGDAVMSQLPPDLARACQKAWTALAGAPLAAVHGDLTPSNVLWMADGRPALLDWDEARVDATVFDTAHIVGAPADQIRALEAWEIACCWQIEPERARRLAAQFLSDR